MKSKKIDMRKYSLIVILVAMVAVCSLQSAFRKLSDCDKYYKYFKTGEYRYNLRVCAGNDHHYW